MGVPLPPQQRREIYRTTAPSHPKEALTWARLFLLFEVPSRFRTLPIFSKGLPELLVCQPERSQKKTTLQSRTRTRTDKFCERAEAILQTGRGRSSSLSGMFLEYLRLKQTYKASDGTDVAVALRNAGVGALHGEEQRTCSKRFCAWVTDVEVGNVSTSGPRSPAFFCESRH